MNSKFCINCGAKLPEGVKFCGSCGTKVEEIVTDNNAQEPVQPDEVTVGSEGNQGNQPKEGKSSNALIVVIAIAIIAVICALYFKFSGLIAVAVLAGIIISTFYLMFKQHKTKSDIWHMIIGLIVTIVFIGWFAIKFIGGGVSEADPISLVKNGGFEYYSDSITVEEAFESYFGEGQWDSYEDNSGDVFVTYNTIYTNEAYTNASVGFIFSVELENETFYLESIAIDGWYLEDADINYFLYDIFNYAG